MNRGMRLMLGVTCALLLSSMVSATASANRLSSNSRLFGLGWVPVFTTSIGSVSCTGITLGGTFHSQTFTKVAGALLGYLTEGSIREGERCSSGTARLLTEGMPWHFRYRGFVGTLPAITAINFQIVGFTVGLTALGITCLYRSTAESPAGIIVNLERGGTVSSVRADESARIPGISGGLCPTTMTMSGTGSGPNQITWRLI
jgi:hypothetical protein